MGNTNGGDARGRIPEEPRWNLPSAQSDSRWLRASLEEIFDRDILRKSFHGADITGGATLKEEEEETGDIEDEAESLADAVACLAYPYDATARKMTVARLTHGLTKQCREEDPFTTTVAQRIHFLRCMHAAMIRAWPRKNDFSAGNSTESSVLTRVLSEIERDHEEEEEDDAKDLSAGEKRRLRRRRRRSKNNSKKKNWLAHSQKVAQVDSELSHTVRMGLNLFFTLLDCMHVDEACSPHQYANLVREMVPIVNMLASSRSPGDAATTDPTADVMNEICDFLYRSSMGRKYTSPTHYATVDEELFTYRSEYSNKPAKVLRPMSASSTNKGANGNNNSDINNNNNNYGHLNDHQTPQQLIASSLTKEKYTMLPVTATERTQALEALYTLACSRASLVDFLLCVKVLLEDISMNQLDHANSTPDKDDDQQQSQQNRLRIHTDAVSPDAMSPSYSPSYQGDAGERSPDADPYSRVDKRGWRAMDDLNTVNAIGGPGFVVPRLDNLNSTDYASSNGSASGVGGDSATAGSVSATGASSSDPSGSSFHTSSAGPSAGTSVDAAATASLDLTPGAAATMVRKLGAKNLNNNNETDEDGETLLVQAASPESLLDGFKAHNNNNEETRSPREWRIRSQNAAKLGSKLKESSVFSNKNSPQHQHKVDMQERLHDLYLFDKISSLSHMDCRSLFTSQLIGNKEEEVQVFSFGQNSYGELGHGDTITRKQPKRAAVLDGKDVVQIAAGNEHTIVLTKSGRVYAVGYNDNGQCGQGNTGRVAHLSNIEALNDKNIVQVHAYNGCEHTLCVTAKGELYSFGYNYRGQLGLGNTASISSPQWVPGFGVAGNKVKFVSCSYYHTVVATESGALFTFGRNDFGQLGLGDTIDRQEPTRVDGFPLNGGEQVISVGCGQYHTVAALSSGSVYACGKNDYGQLGLKLPEAHRRMTVVRFFGGKSMSRESDTTIKELRCGYYHTIALATSGKLWAFGRNDYGQLGIGNATQKVFSPREVEDLDGKTIKVTKIACGCYHSLAVDDNNVLYVFGRNNHGQLGCGESTERHSPVPVKEFSGQRIADVAAGFYHTIVLTGGQEEEQSMKDDEAGLGLFSFAKTSEDEHEVEAMKAAVLDIKEEILARPPSAALTPIQVAFVTILALDRMGAFHRARQEHAQRWRGRKYPPLRPSPPPTAQTHDAQQNQTKQQQTEPTLPANKMPFVVDSDPRSLALLVYITRLCCSHLVRIRRSNEEEDGARIPSDNPVTTQDDPNIWSYLALASLRLIRNNVAQLLWSGQGPQLQKAMSMANLHEDKRSTPIVRALDEVHRLGLDTIESPPPLLARAAVELAQELASEILMTGLELFYPTQELQVQLLASLMAESDDNEDALSPKDDKTRATHVVQEEKKDDDDDGDELKGGNVRFSPRSPLLKFHAITPATSLTGISKGGMRKYLLEPLLRRLADDELVCAMVPYHGTSSTTSSTGSSNKPLGSVANGTQSLRSSADETQASAALLSSLLSSLVRQIATQATRRVHSQATDLRRHKSLQLPQAFRKPNGFLQLLLSLQKHLLSWAANASHPSEEPSDSNGLSESLDRFLDRLGNHSTTTTTLDETTTYHHHQHSENGSGEDEIDRVASSEEEEEGLFAGFAWKRSSSGSSASSSWECLLRYAELVLRKCVDELNQVLEETVAFHEKSAKGDSLQQLFDSLGQGSVVAGVAPSLLVGMSLFANKTYFATRLLPRVIEALQVVDKIARQLPTVLAADEKYRKASDKFGASKPTLPKKSGNAEDPELEEKREQATKKRVDEALTTSSLPWLLQIEKALSSLGGRLASTLVVGKVEGEVALDLARPSEDPVIRESYSMWRDAELFQGGFDPRFVSASQAADHLAFIGPHMESFLSPASVSHSPNASSSLVQSSSSSSIRTVGGGNSDHIPSLVYKMFSKSDQDKFLLSVVNGDGSAKEFIDTIRQAHAKGNFAYNMALVQGRGNGGLDASAMELVERSIFAAVLKHRDVVAEVILFVRNLQKAKKDDSGPLRPSERIRDSWKAAAEVRVHLVRLRSQFMASNTDDSDVFQTVCKGYIKRAQYLLLFCNANRVPMMALTTSKTVHRGWKVVQKTFWTMVKWKALKKSSSRTSDDKMSDLITRFVKCPADVNITDPSAPPLSPTKKPSSPTKRRRQVLQQQYFDLGVLFMITLNNYRRGFLRSCGLYAFKQLLDIPTLASPRTDVLRYLAPALRGAAELDPSRVSQEEGSADQKQKPTEQPIASIVKNGGHYESGLTASGPGLTAFVHQSFVALYENLAFALRDALGEDSDACTQERLLLIDAWAMTIGPVDLELLNRTGLLEVLQRALKFDQDGQEEQGGTLESLTGGPTAGKTFETQRKRQIGRAAWALFRLLVAQIGGGEDGKQVEVLLGTLHDEMVASLNKMLPDYKTQGESSQQESNGRRDSNKHSKEFIRSPVRLSSIGGVTVTSTELESVGSHVDFSVSMWVYLETQSTGFDRVLFARVEGETFLPLAIIRDSDSRVEAWTIVGNEESEHLISKEPIATNKWTHVAIACEAGKLRIFLQGNLEAQQLQAHPELLRSTSPGVDDDLQLLIGRPSAAFAATQAIGPLEGYVAQVKYHSRALSPIHVHIMFDQGPPKHIKVQDKHCFQLLVVQQTLTENKIGRKLLTSSRWLDLYAKLLKYGTPRVQQAVLRIWRVLLPASNPDAVAKQVLPTLVSPQESESSYACGGRDLVDYFLMQIGLGVWTNSDESSDQTKKETTRPSSVSSESTRNETTGDAKTESTKKGKNKFGLTCNTDVCPTTGVSQTQSPLLSRKRKEVQVQTSTNGAEESSHHSFALSSELIMLLRLLATSPNWTSLLTEQMTESMTDMSVHLFSPKRKSTGGVPPIPGNEDMHALRSIGTLAVLGGHTESLRVGARVAMTHADITATVVAFEASQAKLASKSPSALVVMTPMSTPKSQNGNDETQGGDDEHPGQMDDEAREAEEAANASKRSMRAVRMNTDELVPIPEFKSPFPSLSPKKKRKMTFSSPHSRASSDENTSVEAEDSGSPQTREDKAALSEGKEADVEESKDGSKTDEKDKAPELESSFFRLLHNLFVVPVEPFPCSNSKKVLLAQCRARTLKVLHEMLQTEDCNFDHLFDFSSAELDGSTGGNIATALLELSTQLIKKSKFVTMDGMEVRAMELRKRLHQLGVDQSHPFRSSGSKAADNKEESKLELNALTYSDDEEEGMEFIRRARQSTFDGTYADFQVHDDDEEDDDDSNEEIDDDGLDDDDDDEGEIGQVLVGSSASDIEHDIDDVEHDVDEEEVEEGEDEEDDEEVEDDEEEEEGEEEEEEDEEEETKLDYGSESLDLGGGMSESGSGTGIGVAGAASRAGAGGPPPALVEELVAMGFPEEWCIIALRIQGYDLIAASAWIVDNLDMLGSTPLQDLMGATEAIYPVGMSGDGAEIDGGEGKENAGASDAGLLEQNQVRQDAEQRRRRLAQKKKRKRLARAKASMRNMKEPFNQLEEEFGNGVFSENMFRTDSTPSYGYGYQCGALGLYNGLHAEGTQSEAAREAFRTEISSLSFEQLEELCTEIEDELSILHARSCMVVLFQRWREWPRTPMFKNIFSGKAETLERFLRLVLFRGPQILPSYDVSMLASSRQLMECPLPGLQTQSTAKEGSLAEAMELFPNTGDGTNDLLPAPAGANGGKGTAQASKPNDKNAASAGAAGSVMNLLVQAVQPACEQMLRLDDEESLSIGAVLVEKALSDLEFAATNEELLDKEWGVRDLFMTDSTCVGRPNVEFDAWLLSLLQKEGCDSLFHVSSFRRIANLLSSPNMPLKSVAFQLLHGILRNWLSTGRISNVEEAKAIRRLPLLRLQAMMEKRITFERRCGRVFLSKYAAGCLELVSLLRRYWTPATVSLEMPSLEDIGGGIVQAKRHEGHEDGETVFRPDACVVCCACGGAACFEEDPLVCMECKSETALCGSCGELLQRGDLATQAQVASAHDPQHKFVRQACCETAIEELVSEEDTECTAYAKVSVESVVVTKTTKTSLAVAWQVAEAEETLCSGFFVRIFQGGPNKSSKPTVEEWLSSPEQRSWTAHGLTPNTVYTVAVHAGTAGKHLRGSAALTKGKTLDDVPFTFDSCKCGSNISLQDKGMTAAFSALESWSTVLATEGFVKGRHTWEIRIEESDSCYMFIGVATRKACLTTFLGGDEHGWGFIGDRALYHRRNRVNVYGERFGQGDVVGVVLDMDAGTLSFTKNGKDLGVAFEGLAGKLYPAVAFYSGTQRLTLVRKVASPEEDEEENEANAEISARVGLPEEVTLDEILESCEMLESFASGKEISKQIVTKGLEIYKAWLDGSVKRIRTKVGTLIDVQVPSDGLKQKVKTKFGVGTILGKEQKTGRIWIAYDGLEGAWFVSSEDEIKQVIREEKVKVADQLTPEEKESRALEHLDAFSKAAGTADWCSAADEAIVAEVGLLCERKGLDPFNISVKVFEEEILPAAVLRARNNKQCTTPAVELLQDRVLAGVRFTLLKVLNEHFRRVIPCVGINLGFAPRQFGSSAVLIKHTDRSKANKSFAQVSDRLSISQKIRMLRGMIFASVKKGLLREMLDVSATIPKRAEDDYDYPEDLAQLLLNRPKAAFSRTLPDPESRLSFSLVGQAFDALHFLNPQILRIVYSHPMDEGQSRSFRVRFEGEGAEDYGGPYREVFTQWSAELTSTTTSADGAAEDVATSDFDDSNTKSGEAPEEEEQAGDSSNLRCVLPLLHPCPNRLHGVGANREKFVLRPGSAASGGSGAHLLLEMYSFIGQLSGIAMRTKVNLNVNLAGLVWKTLVGDTVSLEDLRDIDHSAVAMIDTFLNKTGGPEVLEAMCEELRWTTTLSDGTQVELFPGGRNEPVKVEHCEQYADVLVHARLRESESAVSALRDGLCSVVPAPLLPLFTAEELERTICGSPFIDIDLLKSCTDYDEDIKEEDPHVEAFWNVLHSFNQEQRQRFLRFVWARSRLPPTKEEFPQKFKLQAPVGEAAREQPDSFLPKSHTCFFALSLPKYSSEQVCREKLLYAINHCLEMDADFRLTDAEQTGWEALPGASTVATGGATAPTANVDATGSSQTPRLTINTDLP